MLRKIWQSHILLVALVCVHFVCPLFCAAAGQKLCSGSGMPAEIQTEFAETALTCCHQSNTADESETSSESENVCCLTDLELILPDNSINVNSDRETVGYNIVSIVPFTYFLPVAQEHLLHLPRPPKLSISSLNRIISLRGPPYTRFK